MIAMLLWILFVAVVGLCLFYFIGRSGVPGELQMMMRVVVLLIFVLLIIFILLGKVHLPGI